MLRPTSRTLHPRSPSMTAVAAAAAVPAVPAVVSTVATKEAKADANTSARRVIARCIPVRGCWLVTVVITVRRGGDAARDTDCQSKYAK